MSNYQTKALGTSTITLEDGAILTLAIASTDVSDRMDDILDQSWDLDNYKANPVVLWAHNHDQQRPPIGTAEWVGVLSDADVTRLTAKYNLTETLDAGNLAMEIRWDIKQELGALVARQYAEGFLRAFSVGFAPGRAIRRNQLPEEDPRQKEAGYGYVFYDNELRENSAVPVPANPDALAAKSVHAEMVERGLPMPTVKPSALSVLNELLDDPAIATRIRGIVLSTPVPEPSADGPTEAEKAASAFWAAIVEASDTD